MVLVSSLLKTPVNYCDFEVIENCDDQEDIDCEQCADGFWREYNPEGYDVCNPCDINKCETCETIPHVDDFRDGDLQYPSCLSCQKDYELVDTYIDADDDWS